MTAAGSELPDPTAVPLPPQPPGVAWPTSSWPSGEVPPGVDLEPLIDDAFQPGGPIVGTRAVLVVHRGALVVERYGGVTDRWGAEGGTPIDASTPLISWSMAKSVLHAAVGILVGEGRLDPADRLAIPGWAAEDPRSAITLEAALAMRDGLGFSEVYEGTSDVIEMLFGAGKDDVAGFVEDLPLAHPSGEVFNYSSGTSNLISGVIRRLLGGGDAYRQFLRDRLFRPLGMESADPRFDAVGTWVASSFIWATARDFARFGLFALRDGVWEDRRVLPAGWVDHGRLTRSVDPVDGRLYGAHWWVLGDDRGTFMASGYEGQQITLCPAHDLVVVRLGKTPEDRKEPLRQWRLRVLEVFDQA